ncbi:MAG TPA: RnfABCDGE type electron transport complex subunit C [Bacillota bacterium]|nr:RnfABCDGE type electron transport complex subunit C [Bacillota bacterium]HPQ62292.1 RnfABCDGE type electron transport complex subunit C [Bacillota bacterium]
MILRKAKGKHIEGKKQMSRCQPLQEYFNPPFVYLPLVHQNVVLKHVVEVGDDIKVGQTVAVREGFGAMPFHASVSGKVSAVKKVWHASGKMVEAIEIENDNLNRMDDSIKPEKNVEGLTKEQLIKKMQDAGLCGMGGASFPTYVKYMAKCPIDTIIINDVECEPYLTCDCMLSLNYPEKVLKGLKYFMKAADATQGVIAIKNYNRNVIEMFAILLNDYPNVRIQEMNDIYPAGWEKYIVEQVTGKTYEKLPSEAGVIVNNSATAAAFADMVENNIPLISRIITITGEGIQTPQNFHVPIGTKVAELIAKTGGYIEGLDTTKSWYIAGGPMTGRAILIDDLIVDYPLGSVIVMPMPEEKDHPECLGCGRCADVCPVFLTPTSIKSAYERKDIAAIGKLNAMKCMGCGLCSYVCPSHVEITDFVAKAKDMYRKGAK